MKEDNRNGQIDQSKLKKPEELDITAEIIKLYQNDPISNKVIRYLLNKYKIIPLNAVENIRQHREEILLNIVNIYKKNVGYEGKNNVASDAKWR